MSGIKKDKFIHFIVGAIVAGLGALFLQIELRGASVWLMASAGIVCSLAAGVAREAWQMYTGQGTVDLLDIGATVAGGLATAAGMVGCA